MNGTRRIQVLATILSVGVIATVGASRWYKFEVAFRSGGLRAPTAGGLIFVELMGGAKISRAWGMPLGYAFERARNHVAGLSVDQGFSNSDRTLRRVRLLEPTNPTAVTATIRAPFGLLQAPFAGPHLDTGFVILARNCRT